MQPLKFIVPGRFWDSQIYSGRLHLFSTDESIRVINWDRLIDEYPILDDLRLPLTCAFSRSDYLYGAHWRLIFDDREIMGLLQSKFLRLSEEHLEAPKVLPSLVSEATNPFPFPHTDSRIYNQTMYVSSQLGMWDAPCHKKLVRGVGQRPKKRWDGRVLAMDIFGSALAMAVGSDGLYETPLGETSWYYGDQERTSAWHVRRIADRDCVNCSWAFTSVYGSSHRSGGFLAQFRVEDDLVENDNQYFEESYANVMMHGLNRHRRRSLDRIQTDREIFDGTGFSWAYRDKIYQASSNGIRIRQFQPWAKDHGEEIQSLGEITLDPWKGQIVSAGVAVFGSIVECDNAIVVLASDGSIHTIPGEPVRWRVFPRSKHYENQLHVIYDDRLEIFSFNHDYFVSQSEKRFGVKPFVVGRVA